MPATSGILPDIPSIHSILMVVAPPPKPTTFEPIVQANGRSLFHLAMEAQEIDGELAIAVAQLSSEDPEEVTAAEELVSSILQRANTSQQALYDKVNQVAFVIKALENRATYFKQQAKTYKEKSDRDQADSDRLLRSTVKILAILHPGKKDFHLPGYDLCSRQGDSTEIVDDQQVPPDLCRHEITIEIPTGNGDLASNLHQALSDFITGIVGDADPSHLLPSLKSTADKKLVKERIKKDASSEETTALSVAYGPATHAVVLKSDSVPGAAVIRKKTWSIK